MVRKGYILAHAACLQIDGHGVLITARTDTGKTTTCLKSIKQQGVGLRVRRHGDHRPRGRALSYPKPLTISSHTLHAVKGAPMSVCGPRGAAGAGPAPLEVRPVRRHGVREHQPARGHDERARPDGRAAAEVPRRPSDPGGRARRRPRPRPARGDRARRRAPARARRGDRVRDLVGQHRGRLRVPAVPADRGRPHERPRGGRARNPSQGGQRARSRAAAHARPRVVRASAVARGGRAVPTISEVVGSTRPAT